MTDDSAHSEEKLTKRADWEYNMCLLNIYMFHRGHPLQTHSANLKKCTAGQRLNLGARMSQDTVSSPHWLLWCVKGNGSNVDFFFFFNVLNVFFHHRGNTFTG